MEGFGQILIVVVFIVVTLLEGVGRKRKAEQKGRSVPGPAPTRAPRPAPPAEGGAGPTAGSKPQGAGAPGSSEGLIPKEVWEEILGLARGTPQQKPTPSPARTSPAPADETVPTRATTRRDETLEEIPDFEARSLEPLAPRGERLAPRAPPRSSSTLPALHREEKAPVRVAAAATARRAAPKSLVMGQPDTPKEGWKKAGGLREELFGGGSPEELRKAVILREVLGPPLALRE